MLVDYEFEEMVKPTERIAALGFRPQSEVLSNHLLPYAAELDAESTKFLEQVKTNLAKSVMLREMKPACGVWSSRLMKYIRMYGLKFSKEHHIAFIKLAYELVLIPDLEPGKIHKFSTLFIMLTKKRYLLSPEELTLPWRQLYDMGKKIFNKSDTNTGMYHYLKPKQCPKEGGDMLSMIRKFLSGTGLDDALDLFGLAGQDKNELALEGSFLSMVKCARPYFPLSATKEILDELLPQINPWTSEGFVMGQLAIFLPVALHHKDAAYGHELWLDELLTLFDTCYNSQAGFTDLMMVFAGLAKRNPGAVDWSPHVPKMFSRIMHTLHLPVSYKEMQIFKAHCLDAKHLASWVVWSICPDGVLLKHLRGFLAGVESYLHSANAGRWSFRLKDFLKKLAREFLNRVRRERKKTCKVTWENTTPESYKLRDDDITEFVTIMLEPTLQAVYSRSGSLDVSLALQNLATLRPALVIPPLLDRLRNALTSLTEPHRVTAGMGSVASVARALLRGPETGYPEGPTHVVPLLMAVLPGLDPNDIKKTLVSLHFILIFAWMVPLIDCSSAPEYYSDLTEEELLTCESTAQLEDFVLLFLDRLFVLIESSVLENVRLDTKDLECFRSKTDAVMETAISSAAFAVLAQCSPKIFKEALRKFKGFATESTFETDVAGCMVAVLLRVFARTDPASTAAAFIPKLCKELGELLTDEAIVEDPTRDILYRLLLLKSAVECDGAVLINYVPMLVDVLDMALRFREKQAMLRSCEVLRNIVQYFSFIEVREWRSSPKDYAAAPEKWLPIREWGHGCHLKNANLKWHIPTEKEVQAVQMLIDRYLKPAVEILRKWLKNEETIIRDKLLRILTVINATLSCGPFLPQPNEEPVALIESQVPATSIPFNTGLKYFVTLDGENVRVVLTRLMVEVQARLLSDDSDDTQCFDAVIKIWEHLLIAKFSRGTSSLETRLRSYSALERAMEGRGSEAASGGGSMRMLIAEAARIQDDSRADLVCEAGITPSALKALDALFQLSINTYPIVRQQAQNRLYWMLSHYPYSYRVLVPKISSLLLSIQDGDEWHAKRKGALFILLGPRPAPLIAKQDWESAKQLWPSILNSPLSEKQSIQKLEQGLIESLHRNFPTINTRLIFSDSVVNAAKQLMTQKQLKNATFVASLKKAPAIEKETSDRVERCYKELMEEIAEIAEKPNIQWRRLESAVQVLSFCPSLQTHYPSRAARLALHSLVHDDIAVRRTALRLMHFVLRQCKRKVNTVEVDPFTMAGVERPLKHIPGYRKDLEWALWSEDKVPLSDEDWEKPILRNCNFGFYKWPETLKMAAPPGEQVHTSSLRREDMTQVERDILEFFTNDANVDKLIAFWTVEEKKGRDKFNAMRFCVLKVLFSSFGSAVSCRFLRHARRCAADTQEAPQRFAAEVAAAAMRAPRYWPQAHARPMYDEVADIVTAGLTTVTPETMEDWGTALATGVDKMDPARGAALVERLVQACVPRAAQDARLDHNTSFVMCARLFALQGALGSMRWRAVKLAKLVLNRLEEANFIQHPYQIVREAAGSLLMTIFDNELVFPGGEKGDAPCLADFLETVLPRLAALYDENGDILIKPATSMAVETGAREETPAPCGERGAPRGMQAGQAGQVAVIAVDVARLSPDLPGAVDNPQAVEGGEASDSECTARDGGESDAVEKQLAGRLEAALNLGGDAAAPGPRDHARATNLLTTVLRGCMGITLRCAHGDVSAQYALVAASCAVAGRGAAGAEELPRSAAGLLAALALQHHPPDAFDTALAALHQRATDRSWWARLACLDFAQPLLFYGLPYMCADAERAVQAEKLAIQLMRDPRLEVRQSASKLLTGLMHCRALVDEEKTLRALTRSCRSKQLVEKHHGVLGLCSYLLSRPYSLGPRLGDVLAELSRHTSAPDPIPATIRTVLAEFRRTHQDDWPKHREQLTEEELDLLADLTSPPSYCA